MLNLKERINSALPSVNALRFSPEQSIGQQQAQMGWVSLGEEKGQVVAHIGPAAQSTLMLGASQATESRLETGPRKHTGMVAEVDERCPYCGSPGYTLYAQEIGNLTRLEGTCRFCGLRGLHFLA
jgi:hypothetical protein